MTNTTDNNFSITQSHLKECLSYDQYTGVFTWLVRPIRHFTCLQSWKCFNTKYAGKEASHVNSRGYAVIKIRPFGSLMAHRLAFLYMDGSIPIEVDHIDHIRSCNKWENLRPATRNINGKNLSFYKSNKSGVMGVCWFKQYSKWAAQIMSNGKPIHLGYFEKKSNAIAARKEAEQKYLFHENHGLAT